MFCDISSFRFVPSMGNQPESDNGPTDTSAKKHFSIPRYHVINLPLFRFFNQSRYYQIMSIVKVGSMKFVKHVEAIDIGDSV